MSGNSIRERILLAVLDAVRAPVETLGATLHRSPTVAISRDRCPALVVFPESESITERANDRVTRVLTVRIVALARAVPPAIPETEADRLLTAAHAALLADRNLGGLALGIREQECEWDVEDADAVAAAIPARYAITYRTLASDLSTTG
ncbi:MAG: hypothetical protein CGU28_05365 [Candidatus Dactylopiibacterium carminicum]|uniref:Uncharacterized protein n=1 Tax=Candidatus Dactylopiibacterium carminicum TaxID=857335 RepID=A0A272ETT4_9RHOO|nr:hypothetical protein [Candidatus Dactylopiibacterium carminicum]KAF7599459.1 hypothetical protein BGI27_07805 [Candidatus Dactylopiibacterium carminicum]PAS93498.1 MAG: hypothetical protein CGU29_07435 [Candidatus Dactylopiibacterium carminicum]PAS97343.1 MAG: hypothetical protein CGU28_05365 [Candidatus Dactylopiibacterium carminicum]PAS99467.1 MAG: hypothetical protein BSR46_07830 [Candidatus Dactylopiibacterium carminicum]